MTVEPASDSAILVRFGDTISPDLHRRVVHLTRALLGRPEIRNLHPAYASVLIEFDPLQHSHRQVEALVHANCGEATVESRLVEIPVRYNGPDLEDVARHTGLTVADVIRIHSGAEYLVYFLGFSPGFPYLGGMPREIATPRLATPRTRVPAGSVAIGGEQTGIYPTASPGGWRIIGETPLQLYTPEANAPTLLQAGDRVRFVKTC